MENCTFQSSSEYCLNVTASLNKTGGQSHPTSSSNTIYISLFLIWIPGFLTNVLALFFIISDLKKAVFPAIVLLLVLCVTDLTAVCFSFTRHMINRFNPLDTFASCATLSTIHTFFKLYSGVTNSLMAVDRVMAICTPFYYKKHVDVTTWKLVGLIAAAVVACLNVLPLMGLGAYMSTRGSGEMFCSSLSYKIKPSERVYGMMFGITGIICVMTIVSLNAVVIRSVLRLNNRVVSLVPSDSSTTESDGKSSTANQTSFEIAFAKLMLCLAAVYLLCETPYNVCETLKYRNVYFN